MLKKMVLILIKIVVKALENAVEENDVEKAKVILELGGSLT
jgi:hypothetical protein